MTTTNAATPATEHTLEEVTAQRDELLGALAGLVLRLEDSASEQTRTGLAEHLPTLVGHSCFLINARAAIARARNVNPTTP